MTVAVQAPAADPRRYFEQVASERASAALSSPVCLYLKVTNCCNLLCETCPRTFETLEPPADMSWELFTRIVDQIPNSLRRAVLHGLGEPMLVQELPRMVRYLKDLGVYVLFNTNGTLLKSSRFANYIATGLDEMRVSLNAADANTYERIRGKSFFDRIVRDIRLFTDFQRSAGATTPRVSLWLMGLSETVLQLLEFVRLAAEIGVREVHLQRLVFDDDGFGLAREESSLFEQTRVEEQAAIAAGEAVGRELGVSLDASGATEPGMSLRNTDGDQPWSMCRRPCR